MGWSVSPGGDVCDEHGAFVCDGAFGKATMLKLVQLGHQRWLDCIGCRRRGAPLAHSMHPHKTEKKILHTNTVQ
eukprot:4829994-Amphidinium_carterae.1